MAVFGSHKLRTWAALTGCVCAAGGLGVQSSKSASSNQSTATSCADYDVIDIHGLDGKASEASPPGAKFAAELRLQWPSKRIDLLASPFKAPGGLFTVSGAGLKLPTGYYKSVVKTKEWLRGQLEGLAKDCPNTKVILNGYSQGAHVVGDVYQEQSWGQVIGVVLFGDPYYNHADSSDRFGLNIKPKQRIKTKLDGALAAPKPRKAFNSKQVVAFCHQEDPVCQAPLSSFELMHFKTGQHKNYTSFKEPEEAAKYLAIPAADANDSPKPASATVDKWPTKRNDGTTVFSMWLAANYLILSDWTSCDPNYCLVGSSDTVFVISIANGFDQIGSGIPIGAASPRAELGKRKVPEQDIDKLLAP